MKSSLLWFQIPHCRSLRNLSSFGIISKMNFLFENTPAFFNYLSNKITNHNILNIETGVRIQLSIIPDSKGICKNIFKMPVFLLNFF